MQLTFRLRPEAAPELPAPTLDLQAVIQVRPAPSTWRASVHVDPQLAGRALAGWELEDAGARPGELRLRRAGVALAALTVTARGDARELELFSAGLAAGRPRLFYGTDADLELEVGCYSEALCALRSRDDDQELDLGGVGLLVQSACGWISLRCAVGVDDVAVALAGGYALTPVDERSEELSFELAHVGTLHHVADRATGPFQVLAGLERSLAHPSFYAPFGAPLPVGDEDELLRIVADSLDPDDTLTDLADELGDGILSHYMGLDQEAMGLLARVSITLASLAADRCELDGDEYDTFTEWAGSALLTCLVAGSRAARAELVRDGESGDLDCWMDQSELEHLALGHSMFCRALEEACGDERAGRVWSLPLPCAMQVEQRLLEFLRRSGADLRVGPAPALLAFMCASFDLGVRFQIARLAPSLLDDYVGQRHLADVELG